MFKQVEEQANAHTWAFSSNWDLLKGFRSEECSFQIMLNIKEADSSVTVSLLCHKEPLGKERLLNTNPGAIFLELKASSV